MAPDISIIQKFKKLENIFLRKRKKNEKEEREREREREREKK